jgi:hypothetical protein
MYLGKIMTGKQLFEKLTVRDFSGSEQDLYAQLLMTIFSHIGDDIFDLLEDAESQNKKLDINDHLDEITTTDVYLVQ